MLDLARQNEADRERFERLIPWIAIALSFSFVCFIYWLVFLVLGSVRRIRFELLA